MTPFFAIRRFVRIHVNQQVTNISPNTAWRGRASDAGIHGRATDQKKNKR
jgi:hypothetical protein